MYGIPNMKLDKEQVVMRRLKVLEAEGVTFVCNTEVGKDLPAEQLLKEYDSVVLCTGATKPRDLGIEGRELKGIHFAMDFLTANTKAVLDKSTNDNFISAEGKDIVIIGGGDTGTDCVGTSIRHGCNSLVQLEILPKPPSERAANNPWPEWPKVYRLDYGQEEAAAKFGDDPRGYLTTATRFEGDENGNVTAVHTVEVEWAKNEKGQFIPKQIAGTEKVLPAQLVLLAMGFLGPRKNGLLEQIGCALDERSNVKTDANTRMSSVPGVFAAGDARRGQSLIVWAIAEGREVARCVDGFLTKQDSLLPKVRIEAFAY